MSDLESEFTQLCEIYDFTNYDFGPASDDLTASRFSYPERYKKTSTDDDVS